MEPNTSKATSNYNDPKGYLLSEGYFREHTGNRPAILRPAFNTAKRLRLASTDLTSMGNTGPKEKPLDYSISSDYSTPEQISVPSPKRTRILPPGLDIAERLRSIN